MKNSQFFVSNMLSLIALLEAGIGISTLPRFAFPQDNKKLIFIPLSNPQVIRDIGMVYLENKSLSPAAQALHDYILEKS